VLRATTAFVAVVLTVACAVVGQLVAWACTSGEEQSGSFEADLCAWMGQFGSPRWWTAVLWPAAILVASQLVPVLRRHAAVVATSIALLAGAFWLTVVLIVVDVG
jgi:hypothetical protein